MAHPGGNGRPVGLRPQVTQALACLVRAGMPPTQAARELGIAPQTLANWRRWGRGKNVNGSVYGQLIEAIEDAQREREQALAELVERARALARRAPRRPGHARANFLP